MRPIHLKAIIFILGLTVFVVMLRTIQNKGPDNADPLAKDVPGVNLESAIRDIVRKSVLEKFEQMKRERIVDDEHQAMQPKLEAVKDDRLLRKSKIETLDKYPEENITDLVNDILQQIPRRTGKELLPTCTSERQQFVYIKNHKCASDTASVIFRRFGYDRNLEFVQPRAIKFNIGRPLSLRPHHYRVSKSGGRFDILTEHTVYDDRIMAGLMKPGAVRFTSIREPFSHLLSSFYFFNVPRLGHISVEANEDPLLVFLNDMEGIDQQYQDPKTYKTRPCIPGYLSVVRNMMSFDLGLPVGFQPPFGAPKQEDKQEDIEYLKQWLERIDQKFDTVSITVNASF